MRLVGSATFRWALIMTSLMTSRASTLRHDDVVVTPGRCLVRCLTLFQVRLQCMFEAGSAELQIKQVVRVI